MGLSGAPLISKEADEPVIGIVIGNKETGMEVCAEEEASDDGKTVEFVYYKQKSHYGLAITSKEIGKLRSEHLGMTIEEYVRKHGLVVEARKDSVEVRSATSRPGIAVRLRRLVQCLRG